MNDEHGCTLCKAAGTERYERYHSSALRKWLYQYDYRHTNGKLFSCVAPSLSDCRARRDKWLATNNY